MTWRDDQIRADIYTPKPTLQPQCGFWPKRAGGRKWRETLLPSGGISPATGDTRIRARTQSRSPGRPTVSEQLMRVLSLGAGVQSSTVLRMSLHGELPALDHAIFADTGWEPAAVYDHLETLKIECAEAGLPLHVVSKGNIRDDLRARNTIDGKGRFASIPLFIKNPDGTSGMGRRQCTSEYKVQPITRKQRELMGLKPRQRAPKVPTVEVVLGISWDETQRMRDPQHAWQIHSYPLVDLRMDRTDCLRWNGEHDFPPPPRSACIGCPFHTDREWLRMRENDLESWDDAVAVDRAIRNDDAIVRRGMGGTQYLHRQLRPLPEVVLEPKDAGQLGFNLECEGMCGV